MTEIQKSKTVYDPVEKTLMIKSSPMFWSMGIGI